MVTVFYLGVFVVNCRSLLDNSFYHLDLIKGDFSTLYLMNLATETIKPVASTMFVATASKLWDSATHL